MKLINCFVILALSAMACFSLAGLAKKPWHSLAALGEAVCLSCRALTKHFVLPFRALYSLGGRRILPILLGLLLAAPLLALVTGLLASADSVFSSLVEQLSSWLGRQDLASTVWRVLRCAVLTLLLFSGFFYLYHTVPGPAEDSEKSSAFTLSSSPAVMVLLLLDLVYLVFCVIQFTFLFGGTETALMSGGYAEYARSGFFQLVAVAAINLCTVLLSAGLLIPRAKSASGGRALLVLSALLLLMTGVILVSAVWRMALYISVYGLSFLRALTLWAMLVIAVGIAAAGIKLFRPGFRFFRLFLVFALVSWLCLSLCNIDARIANYNVDAYLEGRVEQIDTAYLYRSPDSIPALLKLEAHEGGSWGTDAINLMYADRNELSWPHFGLCWIRYGG